MWMWWVSCAKEPSPGDSTTPPGPTADSTAPIPSGDTGATEPPTPTGDTGPDTTVTGGPDPFLSGDQAALAGIVQLAWGVTFPDQWFVSGMTFQPGSYHWTGSTAVPWAGMDSCEVRVDDPDFDATYEDFGALDLHAGAFDVAVTNAFTGGYVASVDFVDVDPRGLTWDAAFGGDYLPAFDLPAAIVFPVDELTVDAPVDVAVVDPAVALQVRWSGTPAEYVSLDLIPEDVHQWVRCKVVDDGAFDVEPAVLAWLTTGRVELTVARTNAAGPAAGSTGAWVQVYAQQTAERHFDL